MPTHVTLVIEVFIQFPSYICQEAKEDLLDAMTNVEEGMEGQLSTLSTKSGCIHSMYISCCVQLHSWLNPSVARYAYGSIFLVTNLLAWMARDYGQLAVLFQLERLQGCHGNKDCLSTGGVLRVSLGCFLFFFIMFLSTTGTKKLSDPRNAWHTSWWLVKISLWLACIVSPFFAPSALIRFYGKIAHVGAGIFLIIQLISVINFIAWLNDHFRNAKDGERCQVQVYLISVTAYVASLTGIVLLYAWYAPSTSCKYNILFITSTLALLLLITSISYRSNVAAGFLSPGLMGVYLVFICWCAIRSEPETESCNKKAEAATEADWVIIISFVIAVIVIAVSAFMIGTDSKSFQLNSEEEAEDDVPYGYGFFHFIFAMGATYFAMLFIGWNAHRAMPKWTIDVGWVSTWVKVVNEWLAAAVYIWKLKAPSLWINGRNVQAPRNR